MRLQLVDNLQTHRRGPLPRPNSYHGFLMQARRHAASAFAVCVAQTAANRKVCMLHLSGGDAEHKSRAALRRSNDSRAAVPHGNVLVELRRCLQAVQDPGLREVCEEACALRPNRLNIAVFQR